MGHITVGFTMSLDGFIADPNDGVEHLFDWYDNGDTPYTFPGGMQVKPSAISVEVLRREVGSAGAIVTGRRLFDHTNGWDGRHPIDVPIFVVTHSVPTDWQRVHPDAPFTFVTDGVENAVRQASAVAGDKDVGIAGPNVGQQAIKAGLVDTIAIELVPVLLGKGIRFIEYMGVEPILLEQTEAIVAPNVVHLRYRIRR